MGDDPAQGVRRKKDSSLVRAAEAVRDGRASAMVSAGNTGATMASALLRMGRLKGVQRPAIATPIPVPGATPTVLLDAGANTECTPQYLVQFAQMGAVFFAERYGVAEPRVGLLSIGEEDEQGHGPGEGDPRTCCAAGSRRAVNVHRQRRGPRPHDRRGRRRRHRRLHRQRRPQDPRRRAALPRGRAAAMPSTEEADGHPGPAARSCPSAELDPDATGGAMLLGVDGVCIISHGSSSARAVVNAVRVARRWSRPTWSTGSGESVADAELARVHKRTIAGLRYRYHRAGPQSAPRGALAVPAETHVERGPLDRQQVFELIRDRLADILEIEPSAIAEGASFTDDLDADSLALIELVEALEEELGERSVGFRIDDEDLEDLKTVRDAVDYVVGRLARGRPKP